MTARFLPAFFLLSFAMAWGVFALFMAVPDRLTAIFGPVSATNPLFFLAVWAPATSAAVLVLFAAGPGGLGRYLSRLFLWRAPPAWYLFLLAGIPAIYYAGAAIKGEPFDLFPFDGIGQMLAATVLMLFLGPVEEFGWRGLALPLMQRLMAPLWAGLAVGVVWAVWHLPAFLMSGTPQSGWEFLPFFVGSVSVSVILTPLFNASRGSILLPLLCHFQLNGPAWPDAQPYDNWLFAAAAVIVVWLNRGTMFTRRCLPPDLFARCRRFQRQRVHAVGNFLRQKVVERPVPLDSAHAGKGGRNDAHAEMGLARAVHRAVVMARMQVAFVDHGKPLRGIGILDLSDDAFFNLTHLLPTLPVCG